MATRLYPTTGSTAISPAVASGWEASGSLVRKVLTTSSAAFDDSSGPTPNGTGSANDDVAGYQLIYGPLAAQTIAGNVKGQFGAREASAGTDARAQCTIRIIAPNGTTVRGTLLAMDTAALSSEFLVDGSSRQNRKVPRGGSTALTSTAATAGDYLVIEVGFRNHNTNTGAVRPRMGGSTSTTDMPEDETTDVSDGTGYRGWFEFSQTISPLTAPTPSAATGTGAATNTGNTVKPTLTTSATGTGAAYQPTISFAPPARTVTINAVDFTSVINLDSFSITECANRGEVGTGGFDVFDSASSLDVPALKYFTFSDPAAGSSNKLICSGFIHDRTSEALRDASLSARQWAVETTDLNILASDYIILDAEGGDRGAETDYARIIWLITSTRFGTAAGVGNGNVVNTNTISMPAADYRGKTAADVLAECSEAASKLWFVYDYGAGLLLYYDTATGTALTSTLKISDAGDSDKATIFAPTEPPQVKKSPDRIYSSVYLTWNGGIVHSTNATTASNYRTREASVLDASITDATLAQAKCDALLAGAAAELVEIDQVTIVVPAAHVNDIRAGQRLQMKLIRQGVTSYTYFRCIRRTITPLNGGDVAVAGTPALYYQLVLGLSSDVLASANGSRGGDAVWPNKSNANDDGATVRIDRGGITITDGGITVTNGSSVVIIDGTSDMFKIAATGSMSVSAANGGSDFTTVSLDGLSFEATPICLFNHSSGDTPDSSLSLGFGFMAAANLQYVANTSGGSPTKKIWMPWDWPQSIITLLGDVPLLNFAYYNTSGSDRDAYVYYHVLQETTF